jgi:hypothetical protein
MNRTFFPYGLQLASSEGEVKESNPSFIQFVPIAMAARDYVGQ